MPSCHNCGAEVVPSNRFCVNCGAGLDQAVSSQSATQEQPLPASEPELRRPRPTRLVALVVLGALVVAVGVVGVLVYRSSSGASGGAASSTGAVRSLVNALAAGDYVAAANVLPPDERSDLNDAVRKTVSLISRSRLTGTSKVRGISVHLASVDSSPLASDVEAVDVRGGFTIGHSRYGYANHPLRLIALREDGRWYVDPLLSIWDYIATADNLPSGDYASVASSDAGGADSPEAAVSALASAIAAKDVAGAERVVAAPEARVLRVFGNAISDLLSRTNYQSTVSQLQLSDGGDGDVAFHGAQIDISRSSGDLRVDLNSRCADWTSDGSSTREYCVLASNELRAKLGVDSFAFRTMKSGEGYRVEVLGTLGDLISRIAERLDPAATLAAAASVDPVIAAQHGKSQPLPEGVRTQVSSDQSYAVYEFPVKRGEAVQYSSSDDQSTGLFLEDEHGHWVDPSALLRVGGVTDFMIAPSDGVAHLVVLAAPPPECSSSVYARGGIPWLASGCWFGSVRDVRLGVRQVPIRNATVPGTLSAHVAPGSPAVFRVDLSRPRAVGEVMKPSGAAWASLFSEQPRTFSWGGVDSLAPGRSWFVLAPSENRPVQATLSLTEDLLGFGLGGGKLSDTQEVSNGYGSDLFLLPPRKAATLAVSSEDGTPFYLSVSDATGTGDSTVCDSTAAGQDSATQSCSIPPADHIRVFSLDIRAYSDFTADLALRVLP